MPERRKKIVPIDTSGPDATIDIEEKKDEAVIEQPEENEQEQEQINHLKMKEKQS